MPTKHVVVLGAGVIGLTTAIRIQELHPDIKVTIVAEVLPSDPRSIKYTSHWAGAHHANASPDETHQKLGRETFDRMWSESEPGRETEHCFLRITQTENFNHAPNPNPYAQMPDYTELPKEALAPNTNWGCTFTTLSIDVPIYLSDLATRFLSKGGSFIKAQVSHIQDILEGGPSPYQSSSTSPADPGSQQQHIDLSTAPDAVVVCTGLGARTLGGVEDQSVFPKRGQTIIVRAPWIRHAKTVETSDKLVTHTYIVPRRSGDVLIGGTVEENDWFPNPVQKPLKRYSPSHSSPSRSSDLRIRAKLISSTKDAASDPPGKAVSGSRSSTSTLRAELERFLLCITMGMAAQDICYRGVMRQLRWGC